MTLPPRSLNIYKISHRNHIQTWFQSIVYRNWCDNSTLTGFPSDTCEGIVSSAGSFFSRPVIFAWCFSSRDLYSENVYVLDYEPRGQQKQFSQKAKQYEVPAYRRIWISQFRCLPPHKLWPCLDLHGRVVEHHRRPSHLYLGGLHPSACILTSERSARASVILTDLSDWH